MLKVNEKAAQHTIDFFTNETFRRLKLEKTIIEPTLLFNITVYPSRKL